MSEAREAAGEEAGGAWLGCGDARELRCMLCGSDYPVWFALNELWNAVVRRPDGSDEHPFLCPTCFGNLAVERGVVTVRLMLSAPDDGFSA